MASSITVKAGDTAFIPIIFFEDQANGVRHDLRGKSVEAIAELDGEEQSLYIDRAQEAEGELTLEWVPPAAGEWTIRLDGLDTSFKVTVEQDITNAR